MIKCPYCLSSTLVWDSFYGSVVCPSCGAVLAESLIDDSLPLLRSRAESRSRRSLERPLRLELEHEEARPDPLVSPINKRALEVLRKSREVYEILVEISRHPKVKHRKLRVRVALALYLYLRLQGYPKSKAVAEASKKAGVSARGLEKMVKERGTMMALEKALLSKQLKL